MRDCAAVYGAGSSYGVAVPVLLLTPVLQKLWGAGGGGGGAWFWLAPPLLMEGRSFVLIQGALPQGGEQKHQKKKPP